MGTINEKISVMQAYADGKEIESRPKGGEWYTCIEPIWDWYGYEYRIKATSSEYDNGYKIARYDIYSDLIAIIKKHNPNVKSPMSITVGMMDEIFHYICDLGDSLTRKDT